MGLVALCLVTGACASATSGRHAPSAAKLGPNLASQDRGLGVADSRIVEVLLHELGSDPAVAKESMGVHALDGIVTLTGTVSTRLAHDRAIERARLVRGVRAIVDRVVVAAVPRPDYEIEFAVAGALSRDPVTAGQRIAVESHGAIVRLTGEIDSNAVRRAAQGDVLAIPGVVDVAEDLAVIPKPRSDGEIGAAAERLIEDDPRVDASELKIEVHDGVVHLSGTVRTAAERARAEHDAHCASPLAVDVHHVRIKGGYDDGTLRGGDVATVSDRDIESALVDAFSRDPRVQHYIPAIDVHDGAVALHGLAPTNDAARAIAEDAGNVLGVTRVRMAVEAPPESQRSDVGIASPQGH